MDSQSSPFVRQGSLQTRKSCVKGPMRRTKSFRVKFSKTIHYNDDQKKPPSIIESSLKTSTPSADKVDAPVIFRKKKEDPKPTAEKSTSDLTKESKRDGLKSKITNRRKPARRPTSHVPLSYLTENDPEKSGTNDNKQGPPTIRKLSITLSPMETRLRELALKYRESEAEKPSKAAHSRSGPLESPPVGKVSGILFKFENQRQE